MFPLIGTVENKFQLFRNGVLSPIDIDPISLTQPLPNTPPYHHTPHSDDHSSNNHIVDIPTISVPVTAPTIQSLYQLSLQSHPLRYVQ